VAKCEGGKVAHEHVYWDHASLPVQVGLLDPAELPATGAGAGRQFARSASAADRMTSDAKTRPQATASAS
jgi:carboxymethylenebutenolidase